MNKRRIIMSIVTASVLFTGCGGGGGGSTSTSTSLSGNVIDPAIKGSTVTLQCGSNTYGSDTTDSNGEFSLTVPTSIDLSSCTIIASGGTDVESGKVFTGYTFKAPYSLANTKEDVYVTPVTTLVAELTEDGESIDNAKTTVSGFLGIDEDKLKNNPLEDTELFDKASDIVDISLEEGSFIDLNGDGSATPAADMARYITDSTKISDEDKERVRAKIEAKIGTVSEMIKQNHELDVYYQLKSAYKYTTSTITDDIKTNLEYLAAQIVEANKNAEGKYQVVTSYHIRKALSDVELLPSFKDDGNDATEDTELTDSLSTNLEQTSADFMTYVSSKTLDISNVDGIVLFNSNSYEQVVGNDETKRRNYYVYSDKSNIAKAVSLTQNVYSDAVNDPINSEVANGLARLGFYDEAFEQIDDNVYTPAEKEDAYRALGNIFLDMGRNEDAAKAYSKSYTVLKTEIEAKGKENSSVNDRNSLIELSRKLGKTGYSEDDNSKSIIGANTVVDYLISFASQYTTMSPYSNIITAIDNLAVDIYYYNDNIQDAKSTFTKNLSLIDGFPIDHDAIITHLYKMAIHGVIWDVDASAAVTKAQTALIEGDLAGTYTDIGQNNGYYSIIYKAFNGDIDGAITDLNSNDLKSGKKDDTLQNGMAAALFLNGKKEKLFTTYYGDNFYYSSSKKDTLMQKHTFLKPDGSMMSTTMMIKIKGGNVELKDYLDRLKTLADSWYVVSSNAADMANNISDSDALKVYAQWSTVSTVSQYGYLAMASMYKDIGEEESAKSLISDSITKVNAFSDLSKKITGLINIWTVIEELGYSADFDKTVLLDGLETAGLHADLDTTSYIDEIIKAANVLSVNGKTTEAKTLVEKAKGIVPAVDQSDLLDSVEDRVKYLIGKYNNTTNGFENSIANGYLQAGDLENAKSTIAGVYADVKSLAETTDQYELLVSVVSAYGNLNDLASLEPIIAEIKTTQENEEARVEAAKALAEFDSFSSSDVATIDSDGDGDPDFFNINATQDEITASGLTLDEDIDGDGTEDTTDTLPYDKI